MIQYALITFTRHRTIIYLVIPLFPLHILVLCARDQHQKRAEDKQPSGRERVDSGGHRCDNLLGIST